MAKTEYKIVLNVIRKPHCLFSFHFAFSYFFQNIVVVTLNWNVLGETKVNQSRAVVECIRERLYGQVEVRCIRLHEDRRCGRS